MYKSLGGLCSFDYHRKIYWSIIQDHLLNMKGLIFIHYSLHWFRKLGTFPFRIFSYMEFRIGPLDKSRSGILSCREYPN